MKLVTISEVAELTGSTFRTVRRRLAEAGIEPQKRTPKSDLFASDLALRAVLIESAAADDGADLDLDEQRARLAKAQADRVEVENAVRAGELLELSDTFDGWTRLIAAARAKFIGLHMKLAPQLAAMTDPAAIAEAIRLEVWAALSELTTNPLEDNHDVERAEPRADGRVPASSGDSAADAGDLRPAAGRDQPDAAGRRARGRRGRPVA